MAKNPREVVLLLGWIPGEMKREKLSKWSG
jgi:hypothetical protein